MMATLTRLTDGQRRGLQVGGVVCLPLGLFLFIAAPIMAILSMLDPSADFATFGDQATNSIVTFVVMGFGGVFLIAAGTIMANMGFMKPVSEIVATETGGALEHAGERGGSGLGRGLAQSGMVAGAGASREVIKIKCRSCGYLESEDAKFCSGCGAAV